MLSRLPERLRGLSKRVGFRLTLWHSFFLTAGCLSSLGLAYLFLSSSLQRSDRENIESKFWDLAGEYQDAGIEALERVIALQGKQRRTKAFFIRFVPPGRPGAASAVAPQWSEFDLAALARLPQDKLEHWVLLPSREDGSALEALSLRLSDGLVLQVGAASRERDEVLRRFRRIVLWVIGLVFVLSVPGGFLVARRAMLPVRQLIATIQKVESGSVGSRVPTRGSGDELDELGLLFNGMLGRIETLIAGMKGALDNVAHDLRTPMARLRMGAEHALMGQPDLASSQEALADCVEESDRLVGMLSTLMDISEAETGIMKLSLEPVDLARVLEESAEVYRYLAEDKKLDLLLDCAGPVPMSGDRHRMRQVAANLIDNAVKYTPEGGKVELKAFLRKGEAVLSVQDSGPGIPAHDLPRVWDRLYRGDSSRSERGLGLGLSLVKAVVNAHRGRVEVDSAGKGCRFTLTFPGLDAGRSIA